jgi:hypothetical protein
MGRYIRCVQRTQISIRRRIGDAASGVFEGASAAGAPLPTLLLQRNQRDLFQGSAASMNGDPPVAMLKQGGKS